MRTEQCLTHFVEWLVPTANSCCDAASTSSCHRGAPARTLTMTGRTTLARCGTAAPARRTQSSASAAADLQQGGRGTWARLLTCPASDEGKPWYLANLARVA
jgi:hypothetical protein